MTVNHSFYLRVGAGLACPGRWLASCRPQVGGEGRGKRRGEGRGEGEGRGRRKGGRVEGEERGRKRRG